MKKVYVTLISALLVFLFAGCGGDAAGENDDRPASLPGSHEIYGVSFPVNETYWVYMFNAEQLGDGEEWIDFEISSNGDKESLYGNYETKEIDGQEIYYYTDGSSNVILAPQSDGEKYIEIRADFIDEKEEKKADKFFRTLMKEIELTNDEGQIVTADYISLCGVRIPAEGLKPSQFFYGMVEMEDAKGVVSLQIDFSDEDYKAGKDKILADLEKDDESLILGSGPFESGGIEGGWFTRADDWSAEESDMMPYMTHYIMVPFDDLQTMAFFGYNFYADVDDLSIYDEDVKMLDEQIRVTGAE